MQIEDKQVIKLYYVAPGTLIAFVLKNIPEEERLRSEQLYTIWRSILSQI